MLHHLYRAESAHADTHSALDTRFRVDFMGLFPLAGDSIDRAVSETEGTTRTFFRIYI